MDTLNEILDYNRNFVESGEYAQFFSNKYPERGLAILSCMDTRLSELLPRALGLKNGDAKLIKNAGALVNHPWGSVMRSLLIAVFELRVTDIMVIAHYDCGKFGIPEDRITTLRNAGIGLDNWLTGFTDVEDSVRHTVGMIRRHPLMPDYIPVHGLVIHPTTGKLALIVNGKTECAVNPA